MAIKVFCDFCQTEIKNLMMNPSSDEAGTLVRAYKLFNFQTGQQTAQREEYNLCSDCVKKALQTLNKK